MDIINISGSDFYVDGEFCKMIVGTGNYWVGNKGNIFSSYSRNMKGEDRKTLTPKNLVYKERDKHGYLFFKIQKKEINKNFYIHKLVIEYFGPPKPVENSIVRHINDLQDDNRIENLMWGTLDENIKDKYGNNRNYKLFYLYMVKNHPEMIEEYENKKYGIKNEDNNLRKIYNSI